MLFPGFLLSCGSSLCCPVSLGNVCKFPAECINRALTVRASIAVQDQGAVGPCLVLPQCRGRGITLSHVWSIRFMLRWKTVLRRASRGVRHNLFWTCNTWKWFLCPLFTWRGTLEETGVVTVLSTAWVDSLTGQKAGIFICEFHTWAARIYTVQMISFSRYLYVLPKFSYGCCCWAEPGILIGCVLSVLLWDAWLRPGAETFRSCSFTARRNHSGLFAYQMLSESQNKMQWKTTVVSWRWCVFMSLCFPLLFFASFLLLKRNISVYYVQTAIGYSSVPGCSWKPSWIPPRASAACHCLANGTD